VAKELILVLGGARSGKSSYAEKLAAEISGGRGVLYVATAEAWDDEMRARIAKHRADRPAGWRTVEAPRDAGRAAAAALAGEPVVLLDCMTLLTSNVVIALPEGATAQEAEAAALAEAQGILDAFRAHDATWIVVSNEVGLGIVPAYPLGRLYRDALGRVNQKLAAEADRVVLMVAGLPMRLKIED
jgi:adenosylcobinamide kinase/adenosylcobinamide-phosphate guanylyltransferase